MRRNLKNSYWVLGLIIATMATIQGCDQRAAKPVSAAAQSASDSSPTPEDFTPVTVQHALGTTVIEHLPQRVAALDMNEVDFLDQLNIPIVGMPKDFIPHFLSEYQDAPGIQDLGAIVHPNLERVHAARPDLILITSLQANHYNELTEIAPTIHFDVDYRNSQANHIEIIKDHLMMLGRIFNKEGIARQQVAELTNKVEETRRVTQGRPERALILLHNNGAFSSFGVQSRYGFIFTEFGVQPASPGVDTGLHGQPISSEFIQQANPDIIYVVDRTAVMENHSAMDAERMANPLIRQTNAWKNGRVIFVDAEAWYITAASISSLAIIADEIIEGYQD